VRGRTAGLLTSIVLVAAGTPAAVAGQAVTSVDPTVGATGIGDPYFPEDGNGGYRVEHYDIGIDYQPSSGRLVGDTTITATAGKALTRLNLDLLVPASEVTVDGQQADFEQSDHELKVSPAQPLAAGARFTVRVRYAGEPASLRHRGEKAWFTTKGGAVALGQPQVAAWWFPSNDHPSDKARFDISVTVPHGKQAISGGALVDKTTENDRTTWHWRMPQPMATYLAFTAIGNYQIDRGTTGTGLPFLYAYDKQMGNNVADNARRAVGRTGPVTSFLTDKFGSYPYDQIGGVATTARLGFALETQTRPIYDAAFFFYRDISVIVHEMAHQWFGDAVALQRWKNIWINEGYATYAEWIFAADRGGQSAERRFRDLYERYSAGDTFWKLRIGDPGPNNIFDGAVYVRGAMTLHALRNRIGGDAFFKLSRRWVKRPGGVASTGDYRRLAERISGEDLGSFFDAWLYSGDKPDLP